jgi:hypothetical protein
MKTAGIFTISHSRFPKWPGSSSKMGGVLIMSRSILKTTSKKAGANEILDVLGPHIQHLTALSDADDDYCLIRSNFPAGVVVPIHTHADRETFYIHGGEFQELWKDRWITLVTSDVLDDSTPRSSNRTGTAGRITAMETSIKP